MAQPLQLTLEGNNLGEKHRCLNFLVNNAYKEAVDFSHIESLPAKTPIDNIFKIDLASKYRNVEFIIKTLKDEDMLYVSRALKSSWLFQPQYKHIINPLYLEEELYPEMTTTAVNKMKHWIERNLKDTDRCEQFYLYYKNNGNLDTAIKFLHHCSSFIILYELLNGEILEKITTPQRFKILCETFPHLAVYLYAALKYNKNVYENYMKNPLGYYQSLKFLLKTNHADLFLDITEKYFIHFQTKWNVEATKYLMEYHKERFDKKPELYMLILDMKTVAKFLTQKQIKDLILKLARAKYLQTTFSYSFSYEKVAPLIKAIYIHQRDTFKKQIFTDKNIGKTVQLCPYEIELRPRYQSTKNIFEDEKNVYYRRSNQQVQRFRQTGGGGPMRPQKTPLDKLFDQYRCSGFGRTFNELSKKMSLDSWKERQNMMLVLVSKAGECPNNLELLLKFLVSRYGNETDSLRATVIRSLVRRCSAWRLPEASWALLLQFSHGLGLLGEPATVACSEGLHALLIRHILHDTPIDAVVLKAYINDFSTLANYALTANEKDKISKVLPNLLMTAAENYPKESVVYLEKTLQILAEYQIAIDVSGNLIPLIIKSAKKHPEARSLLCCLYDNRIACKRLFSEYFALNQNDASYLNALKHDTSVLASGKFFATLVQSNDLAHDKFLKSLALYFNEDNGLAQQYLSMLLNYAEEAPQGKLLQKNLARSIAILSGDKIVDILTEFNNAPKKSERRRFSAALRANAHLARPLMDLEDIPLEDLGAKGIANRIMMCSTDDAYDNLQYILDCPKTQKLLLLLSTRTGDEVTISKMIGEDKPKVVLKTMLRYLKRNKLNDSIWTELIRLIAKLGPGVKINSRLIDTILGAEFIPENIAATYFATCYKVPAFNKLSVLGMIENNLHEMNNEFVENVISEFLNEKLDVAIIKDDKKFYVNYFCMVKIIAKYLLLCKTHVDQETKWEIIGQRFFTECDLIWENGNKLQRETVVMILSVFLKALKYSKVFLNPAYVSCDHLIEKIGNRLKKTLSPAYKYIDLHLQLHFTAVYYSAVRECMKHNPHLFEDLNEDLHEVTKTVGNIFGQLVGYSVIDWTEIYFDSIKEIYGQNLVKYLSQHFPHYADSLINKFIRNIVKGILECDNSKSHLLAERIFCKESKNWQDKQRSKIFEKLKKSESKETRFFVYHKLKK